MVVTRKTLFWTAGVVAALFIVAFPLGDSHNGLGRHNQFFADLGQTIWVAFLISVPVLLVLIVVAAIQTMLRTRRADQHQT